MEVHSARKGSAEPPFSLHVISSPPLAEGLEPGGLGRLRAELHRSLRHELLAMAAGEDDFKLAAVEARVSVFVDHRQVGRGEVEGELGRAAGLDADALPVDPWLAAFLHTF